ncbi:MAG: SIR2 family protein [Chloroflexi bacterium]|nr:SIR2 family protein [Chloroflexota bacterium]
MDNVNAILARLQAQVSRGEPVLFLGAGFSVEAIDTTGQRIPTATQLTEEFWKLVFPGDPFDPTANLGEAFQSAKIRNPKGLKTLISERLSVDAEGLDPSYADWFSVPWSRCYTLNIDDLEQAVTRRFPLSRGIRSISATSDVTHGDSASVALEVIHLNGAVWDELDALTFSEIDYAARLTRPEKWYINCVADLMARPVVFVGTRLQEPMLWQYIEFRRTKGPRSTRELRPGSYFVSPSLNSARRLMLQEFNIDWVPLTAREFAAEILTNLSTAKDAGHKALRAKYQAEERRNVPNLVSDLAAQKPTASTEYLLGQEPTWSDLHSGRAIERDCDSKIYELAYATLASPHRCPPLVISGTAGSGKSTALMRLGLRLTAEGVPVYWIDEQSNIAPYCLRDLVLETDRPLAILVDDADLWGGILSGWAREIPQLRAGVLFVSALRSSKVDGLLDKDTLAGTQPQEVSMPPLTDADIEALIHILDKENRLGILKGKSHQERVQAFEMQAGRQLLVAMIQATSGMKFVEKVIGEFSELSETQRLIYAVVSLAFSQRFSLSREEILIATGESDNKTLDALEQLVRRYIITRDDLHVGYKARHRVIADTLVSAMQFRPFLGPVLEGLCFAFANRISPQVSRTSRQWRRLIRFMNHDFVLQIASAEIGRDIYTRIEPLLHWDYHYWLQRGSLEVEKGDLEMATNFINQARSLAPGTRPVETEYAYLLMKKAARNPWNTNAPKWFTEGHAILEDLINEHGKQDPYPFHILGTQGLAWTRQASLPLLEKRSLLRHLLEIVNLGIKYHPRAQELPPLATDLRNDWMMTAVAEANS